jgi:hypothetical protein
MSSRHLFAATLLLLSGAATPLLGQGVAPQVGDRVRLRTSARSRVVEGRVVRFAPDTLVLLPGGRGAGGNLLVIPTSGVRSLDVQRGRASAWRTGAEIGSFAGFVLASAIFAARMQRCVGWECGKSARWLPYAAGGSLAGAAGGSLVGLFIQHDRWEGVAVHQGAPLVTLGEDRVGVRVSLRF